MTVNLYGTFKFAILFAFSPRYFLFTSLFTHVYYIKISHFHVEVHKIARVDYRMNFSHISRCFIVTWTWIFLFCFLFRCDMNEGERNYNVCFFMFSFMMCCALLVATQIQFRYLSPKQVSREQFWFRSQRKGTCELMSSYGCQDVSSTKCFPHITDRDSSGDEGPARGYQGLA